MKITITTIAALLLTTSIAGATPKPTTGNNTNTNLNHNSATAVAGASANAAAIAAQQQAQQQGQAQGQNQTASANNANTVSSSNAVSNNVTMEGSAAGVSFGGAHCTTGGGIGLIGVTLGGYYTNKECVIMQEAAMLAELGLLAEARTHMTQIERVAQSVRANQPQAPAANIGTAVSFSAAAPMEPAQLSYIKCDLDTTVSPPKLTVQPRTDELAAQARVDCLAAHGF
jgi:hypothetical protein